MIGDKVNVKQHHYPPAREIISMVRDGIGRTDGAFAIGVGGESGSGKSTLSLAMKELLEEEEGLRGFIFHMDDYFRHPPQDNHQLRINDLSNVGPQEVRLELLEEHIRLVKAGAKELRKPLVHYRENVIREIIVELDRIDVVIVEGTYVTLLEPLDSRVFMLRNYRETYEARRERARDPVDALSEQVLEIEHGIVSRHAGRADILVDREYRVTES